MNVVTLCLVLIWFVCGYFVVKFVHRTGGHTIVGRIAHWFGGTFVMIVLAIGITWIYAGVDHQFGARAHSYILTHQLRIGDTRPLIQQHDGDDFVTVYRPGSVNMSAVIENGQIRIDETKTIRTSWWWVLWNTSFTISFPSEK